MLFINPMLQHMGVLGKGLDLLIQHCNGHPLALIIIVTPSKKHHRGYQSTPIFY